MTAALLLGSAGARAAATPPAVTGPSTAAQDTSAPAVPNDEAREDYDVVIYGGTSAAIIAAVQVRRMGHSVVVVSPDTHLGGLSAGGLGWTDSGDKVVIGGLSREFYRRVKQHYDQPGAWRQQAAQDYGRYRPDDDAMWVFEPHVAEQIFDAWVVEYAIPVARDQWLDRDGGVQREAGSIRSIRTLDGAIYRGRVFLDATYEGDLMAAADVTFHVGRESNARYGETLNGVQTRNAVSHQFQGVIDPYVVRGDPKSGLLPGIHAGPPGEEGAGDHRVQAYNFRLCLTDAEANQVPFVKPDGYDPRQYELLLRTLLAGHKHVHGKFDPAPNKKTDTNNHGPFSTDNIGMNYDYPTASYPRRLEIVAEHERYQRGYFYFLCNDERVPEDVQTRMRRWGLAKDEFAFNDHWPHQIYVREARRMVSDFVMSERHLRGLAPTPRPVGMGSYNMDSHNVQRYVAIDEDGVAAVRNEGDVQVSPGGPYPIAYDALIPRRRECSNLLVPVCLSSSHIAYGSIRMEPVFMILGQSAATGACLAIEGDVAVQDVEYGALKEQLLRDGQVLDLPERSDDPAGAPIAVAALPGIVQDDTDAALDGAWVTSTSQPGFLGLAYRHDNNEGKGTKRVRFTLPVLDSGRYEVRMSYTAHKNRADRVPITVNHRDGATTVMVDQRVRPAIDGLFHSLGVFEFDAGLVLVTVSNQGTEGFVIADGAQLVKP